jgi:glycine reductase
MSIAESVGANRIIIGGDFTAPIGDPDLPCDREEAYRVRILEKSVEAMKTDVSGPTVFSVRKDDGEDEGGGAQ